MTEHAFIKEPVDGSPGRVRCSRCGLSFASRGEARALEIECVKEAHLSFVEVRAVCRLCGKSFSFLYVEGRVHGRKKLLCAKCFYRHKARAVFPGGIFQTSAQTVNGLEVTSA